MLQSSSHVKRIIKLHHQTVHDLMVAGHIGGRATQKLLGAVCVCVCVCVCGWGGRGGVMTKGDGHKLESYLQYRFSTRCWSWHMPVEASWSLYAVLL